MFKKLFYKYIKQANDAELILEIIKLLAEGIELIFEIILLTSSEKASVTECRLRYIAELQGFLNDNTLTNYERSVIKSKLYDVVSLLPASYQVAFWAGNKVPPNMTHDELVEYCRKTYSGQHIHIA